jgi:hypothetical protein
MLFVRPIMNSAVEQVLEFKTCCGLKMFDQNLEIHVRNLGDRPVRVPGWFELVGDFGTKRIDALSPPGERILEPGSITAFYCYMDEAVWNRATELIFPDCEGNAYPVAIKHGEMGDGA